MKETNRQRIVKALSGEILASTYAPDVPMPSEHELCARFEVSRITVRLALSDLEHKGLLYRRHGSGTYAHPVKERMVKPLLLLEREPQKVGSAFFTDLIRGINGYLMTIGSHLSVVNDPPRLWFGALTQSVAGVIVVPNLIMPEDLRELERLKLPYVICPNSEFTAPTVGFDVKKSARKVTQGLLDLGHRKFALISGHAQHTDKLKKEGIAEVLSKAGIEFSSVPDYMTNYDEKLGRLAAQKLFHSHPDRTAVIATDDVLALIVVQVAQQIGKSVPFDLSVVGFNDLAISALFEPALSTVHYPILEAGRTAAEMVCLHVLKGSPLQSVDLAHKINWRQTTGPARPG